MPKVDTSPAVRNRQQKRTFHGKTFAEFFAGIGLVREALRASGWQCIYANDIDPKKREIYETNFTNAHEFDERDIWDTKGVLEKLGRPLFLATASFPCIDLSVAGHYRGFDGQHSSTFFGFAEVIRQLQHKPRILLLENVSGFLTARGGDDFRAAVLEIARLGYFVDAFTLNAASFVPQSRPRVFLIGIHEEFESPLLVRQSHDFTFGDPWYQAVDRQSSVRPSNIVHFMMEMPLPTGWVATPIKQPPKKKLDLRSLIDLGDDQRWWDVGELERHYEMLNDRHRQKIDEIVKLNGDFVGTGYRRKRHGRTRLEVRFDGIAGCLRTPRGGSAKQIVVVVDQGRLKMKWMSAKEYARLQGAGRFKCVDNERQMLFGFGDAVCVPVVKWIDKCVLTPLFDSYLDGSNPD